MDGLLLDSEVYWERARHEFCANHGCDWRADDELTVKGNNSPEWAAAIVRRCRFSLPAGEIIEGVVGGMKALYAQRLPLLPGAVETVRELAKSYPLAVASSSPPELIDFALERAGIHDCFQVLVSADTTGRGKPAPDVFLATARQLGCAPADVAVFEDSTAGIRAGRTAGMRVLAVPNAHYPPDTAILGQADVVLPSLAEFRPEMLDP